MEIIENVWGLLVQTVYDNGKQCGTIAKLRASIKSEWDIVTIKKKT